VWGRGKAKTLEHSLKEIEEGESVLIADENGELLRNVVVGGADIFYIQPDGKRPRLIEEKQVFKDGRERVRNLGQAVSEKMKPDEDPKTAMIRGIKEELAIDGEVNLVENGVDAEVKTSDSYPGLKSQYVNHRFVASLNDRQFKQEGYVEHQSDKSTYFVWRDVDR
jgi:hypothetical protein